MKILITDIHHGNGGGHVTYVLNLLQGLRHHCELTLACPPTGRLYRQAQAIEGIRVLPGLYTSRPASLFDEVRRLRAFLLQERFDLVHANGGADHRHLMLACLGWKQRPAIVWTKHNTNPVDSIGHRLRARFGTDLSIAVCNYVAAQLNDSGYRSAPIEVVRNGLDLQRLQPAAPEEREHFRQKLFGRLDPDVLVLSSVGGTDHNKGWLLLVEALARLEPALRRRFRVVVAGDPPEQALVERVNALSLSSQVVFPGLVANVRTLLGASDVGFVLSYREAASYASCETMAMALPTLVSSAGGLPENVRDGVDGWVVPVGDVDAVERCLHDMLQNPVSLHAKGQSAHQRVEHMFAMPVFLEHTERVYRQAIARRHPQGSTNQEGMASVPQARS